MFQISMFNKLNKLYCFVNSENWRSYALCSIFISCFSLKALFFSFGGWILNLTQLLQKVLKRKYYISIWQWKNVINHIQPFSLGFHEKLLGLPRESVMGKSVFLNFSCCTVLPLIVVGIFMWCDSAASCHFAVVYVVKHEFCRLLQQ